MEKKIENIKCYIYVLNTLADWEVGYLTAELKSNRFLLKNKKYELITIGSSLELIETMGGFLINPEKSIEDINFKEGDLLVLPGADTWMEDTHREVLDLIPDLLKKKVIVAAICGATFALARIGLLNNKRHTSNDKGYLKMICPEYSGDSLYINTPVAVDENLITASGIAPLEFTYEILKMLNAMKEDTLEAWYQLYRTKDSKYFYNLMESLK